MNSITLDRLGGVASASCALHCLMTGLAPALIALLGVEFLANEAVEWGLFAAASVFAITAAVLGFRVHRSSAVLLGFSLGLASLITARVGEAMHLFEGTLIFAVLGGVILVVSHVVSARRTKSCQKPCCQ
jgi:hypothetical protein